MAELTRVLALDTLLDPQRVFLGINNRDLTTFEITLENTRKVMDSDAGREVLNRGLLMTGESGIFTYEDVEFVQKVDYSQVAIAVRSAYLSCGADLGRHQKYRFTNTDAFNCCSAELELFWWVSLL